MFHTVGAGHDGKMTRVGSGFFFFFLQRLEFFLLFPFKWLSMARSLPSSALALLELRGSMLFTGAVDQTWITYFYPSSHLAEWLWPDRERIFSPRPRKTSCATDRREERILINDTTWPQIVPQGWVLSRPGNYEAPGEPIKRRFSEANLFWFFFTLLKFDPKTWTFECFYLQCQVPAAVRKQAVYLFLVGKKLLNMFVFEQVGQRMYCSQISGTKPALLQSTSELLIITIHHVSSFYCMCYSLSL